MKKSNLFIALVLTIMLGFAGVAKAEVPNVTTATEEVAGFGKVKIAISDPFTTEIDGQEVKMSISYLFGQKNQPSFNFLIYTQDSKLYKEIASYLDILRGVINNIKVGDGRPGDIYSKGKDWTWSLGYKYGVGGSSLVMVNSSTDTINGVAHPCMMVMVPMGMMDSNRYDWKDKNHWKDFQQSLLDGSVDWLEYFFYRPGNWTNKVAFTLPINYEMRMTLKKLVDSYNAKKK